MTSRFICCTVEQNKIKKKYNKQKRKSLHNVPWNVFFFTIDVNVKWRSETFNVINIVIVQSVVVLNINTEVFRIYDMNILYKLGDLRYNGKRLCTCGASLAVGRTCPTKVAELAPDRLFPNIA